MNRNPFLDDNGKPEDGSLTERTEVRHAMRASREEIPDIDTEWERLSSRLHIRQENRKFTLLSRRTAGWAAAAIVALSAITATLFLRTNMRTNSSETIYVAKNETDSSPDVTVKHGNSLQRLKSGSVYNATTVTAESSEPDVPVIIETTAGMELQVKLPDNTMVWLWANSRLEFPEEFEGDLRTVRLNGEAYFDVATDSVHPFVVETPFFEARVYGTEFGIMAGDRKTASVMLVDGSLAVKSEPESNENLLEPGQLAVLDPDDSFNITEVDTYEMLQWRDGLFYFDDDSLFDVLLRIGKWYNISVVAENQAALATPMHFSADRNAPIHDIVNILSELSSAEVIIEDNTIIVR